MMQYCKTIASLLLKQVQTCSKHDAIKPIHCIITIFKRISICSKDDAIIPKEAMEFALAGFAGLCWLWLALIMQSKQLLHH